MTSYISSLFSAPSDPYKNWKNIEVDLHVAQGSEKRGWVGWFVNNTMYAVTKTLNTWSIYRNFGYMREIFARTVPTNKLIASYPSWIMNFHICANPKINKIVFEQHRGAGAFFTTKGQQKSAFVLLMELLFPKLDIGPEDIILTCNDENSTKLRTFLHSKLTQISIDEQKALMRSIVTSNLDRWAAATGPISISDETRKFTSEIIAKLFLGYEGPVEELTKAIEV